MAGAAGCILFGQPGGRAGRVWSSPSRPARSCCARVAVAGPNRFKVTQHRLSYGDFLMQKWELTYEIIGSAVAISALLVPLWRLGFVS